jgi:hypothetical protein
MDLLEKAGLGADARILAVGDILDRGPDSGRVLELFRSRERMHSVLGNHERAHRRILKRGTPAIDFCQRVTQAQLGPSYAQAVGIVATFPAYCELDEALVVHGLLEPGLRADHQLERVLTGTAWGENYLAERYGQPWYELYDGPKPLIIGHRDYRGDGKAFVYRDRVFGIDTGCCYGRRLTGLVLPELRLVSVPARADYWASTCRRYAELRGGTEGD